MFWSEGSTRIKRSKGGDASGRDAPPGGTRSFSGDPFGGRHGIGAGLDPGAAGPRPLGGVGYHPDDVRVVVSREGLVARPEVEDAAVSAPPAAPAPEHLASLEPREEHLLLRGRDREGLAVHLLPRELKVPVQAPGYGVARVADPQPLALSRLPPRQRARGPHQPPEDLRIVARVEDDEAHSLEHAGVDPADHLVAHLVVGQVPPPREHVGVPQPPRREAVLGLLERGRRHASGRKEPRDPLRYGRVHPARVYLIYLGTRVLVYIFAPDGYPQ